VKATTEHIVQHLPGGRPERLVLLTDCMSPVGGFEAQAETFLATMRAKGVRLMTSTEAAALLNA
jgi:nicotinamidase/pyrazinamidase